MTTALHFCCHFLIPFIFTVTVSAMAGLILPFWDGDDPLEGAERVVEDLEDADEAESHAESEEAARVGHEGDHRNLLVTHYLCHNRVLRRGIERAIFLVGFTTLLLGRVYCAPMQRKQNCFIPAGHRGFFQQPEPIS